MRALPNPDAGQQKAPHGHRRGGLSFVESRIPMDEKLTDHFHDDRMLILTGFFIERLLLVAGPTCSLDQIGPFGAPQDEREVQVLEAEDVPDAIGAADLRDHQRRQQLLLLQHVEDLPGRQEGVASHFGDAFDVLLDRFDHHIASSHHDGRTPLRGHRCVDVLDILNFVFVLFLAHVLCGYGALLWATFPKHERSAFDKTGVTSTNFRGGVEGELERHLSITEATQRLEKTSFLTV
jgi:hypothetical protein